MLRSPLLLGLWLGLLLPSSLSYYLPGFPANDYPELAEVPVQVNPLKSERSVIPYDHYYSKFAFCEPEGGPSRDSSNLGALLFGDRLFNSPITLKMKEEQTCKHICTVTLKPTNTNFLIERIQEKYKFNWFVDSLPAAVKLTDAEKVKEYYTVGFDLGVPDKGKTVKEARPKLNNHYTITVEVHELETSPPQYRVVGVLIRAQSRTYMENGKGELDCAQKNQFSPVELSHDAEVKVHYTYDVFWVSSEKVWATRWDNYLQANDPKVHWFSLVNSFVIVIFLTFMVAMILLRALHKDISRYNQETPEEAQEEYGWKLVHGDVFRSPSHSLLLSVLVGNGVQLFLTCCTTLALALFGFLSPSTRGLLITVSIAFYVCFGFAAGYTAARMYKMNGGEAWKRCVFLTATLVPGSLSVVLVILNFILVGSHSSAAVPFGTLVGLLALWTLISCPLCFVGAYLGFKQERVEFPTRVNHIPRQIPPQPYYLQRLPSILLGGILPFGAIFIELFFIMNSIWFNRVYYVFGFLFMVFLILTITCSEVTILMCYFHLCSEDYRWWWRAFFTSGSSALYVLAYSVLFFYFRLEMSNFVSTVLYFGWTAAMALVFFILTGTIGFLACLMFVRKIYSSIKID